MPRNRSDALRAEVGDRLVREYGDLKAAAAAIGMPYKTMYRMFTSQGKDRTQTVSLESVIAVVEHMRIHVGGDDFADVWESALTRIPRAVEAAPSSEAPHDLEGLPGIGDDELADDLQEGRYAADRRERKADREPFAE